MGIMAKVKRQILLGGGASSATLEAVRRAKIELDDAKHDLEEAQTMNRGIWTSTDEAMEQMIRWGNGFKQRRLCIDEAGQTLQQARAKYEAALAVRNAELANPEAL